MSASLIHLGNARIDVESRVLADKLELSSNGSRLLLMGDWSVWFRLLRGEAKLRAGSAEILGLSVPAALASGRVGLITPSAPLPGSWTVQALFYESARLAGFSHSEARARAPQVLVELNLATLAERRVETLSRLEHRAMWVAHALITWPEVVFVEQLFAGVPEHEHEYLWQLTEAALNGRKWGMWLPFADPTRAHGTLLKQADERLLLDQGRLAFQGPDAGTAIAGLGFFRLMVATNAPAFFEKLASLGLNSRYLSPVPHAAAAEALGGAGRGIVELSRQDSLRTILSLSLSEQTPVLELVPLNPSRTTLAEPTL